MQATSSQVTPTASPNTTAPLFDLYDTPVAAPAVIVPFKAPQSDAEVRPHTLEGRRRRNKRRSAR